MKKQLTFGLIVGNRGFFPDHLAKEGREEMLAVLKKAGVNVVALSPKESKYGAVETHEEARLCGELFRKHRDDIDGVIVTLPNFGDERAIADTLRYSTLKVPVLMQATPDNKKTMKITHRRDSFCGKMSACNNLMQYGIPYSLTRTHTVQPDSAAFRKDLEWFSAVCRVVDGLRNLRICAIGARPQAFNTVRFSEKLLERSGITVVPIDLSEVLGLVGRMKDTDDAVQQKLTSMTEYVDTSRVPKPSQIKLAKLGVALDSFTKETETTVSAIQCWTSLQINFGAMPCTWMSMRSEDLSPSACEMDIMGTVSMHALALAGETPAALLDWNNNYGDDPDKAVCFHCSNLPKSFFEDVVMNYQDIIAGTVGKKNTYGTVVGRVHAGAMSFARFSTDEFHGKIRGYVGQGEFTKDPLETFGGAGVVRIPKLQKLLRYICSNGLEHHTAASFSSTANAIYEAATKYLGWEMYEHEPEEIA